MTEFGCRQITTPELRNIVGINALRLLGRKANEVLARVSDDAFARAQPERAGEPWALLRPAATD